jgi:hypothetical protein
MPYLYFAIGLPMILFSGFSRTYTINSLGSCFFIDTVSWGPFCWPVGSFMPEAIVYGANAAGLALVFYGYLTVRRLQREKIQQIPPPPQA